VRLTVLDTGVATAAPDPAGSPYWIVTSRAVTGRTLLVATVTVGGRQLADTCVFVVAGRVAVDRTLQLTDVRGAPTARLRG
jgi:hypothetical protein